MIVKIVGYIAPEYENEFNLAMEDSDYGVITDLMQIKSVEVE